MNPAPKNNLSQLTIRRPQKQKGQTIIEFVIVFMIFLMMAGFAVEISNYFRARSLLTLGAFSAARAYAVRQDMGYAQYCAQTYLKEIAANGNVVAIPSGTPGFGAPFTMTVMMQYQTIVPWFTYFLDPRGTAQDNSFINMYATVNMVAD